LWNLKLLKFLGPPYEKEYEVTNTKLGMKVNIYRALPRVLEGARASEGPSIFRFISITVNPSLLMHATGVLISP